MVAGAWAIHCRDTSQDRSDRAARDAWYRAELIECLGKDSTKTASATRDFEAAMAHFESIFGDSIYWQMAQFRGDARRVLHELDAICERHNIDEDYLRRIARVALKFDAPPQLIDLTPDQLLIILRAARIHARRQKRSASTPRSQAPAWECSSPEAPASPDEPVELSDENPF